MRYLIGLDLGSGSIRAGAFDLHGRPAAIATRPTVAVQTDPTNPGYLVWPYQEVWTRTCEVLREVMSKLPEGAQVAGVATACLGMDGLPIDRNGKELFDFISWTDTRCEPYYEKWLAEFGEDHQFLATGTPPRGFSTVFRLQWMKDNHPEILERTHKWVLMGDYINMRLCGELATDFSMASCTLLFNPVIGEWDKEIAAAADVDLDLMCQAQAAGNVLGSVSDEAEHATNLPKGTPVVLGGHDYLCGVLPVGGHESGTIVNVGGTWDVLQATLPKFDIPKSAVGKGLTIQPHVAPGRASVFGGSIGGAVTDWFKNHIGPDISQSEWYDMSQTAAGLNGGKLMFLPHFAGASGPVVDNRSAGAIIGLRSTHTATNILSAVFEGLAFQAREVRDSLIDIGVKADRFVMVGGSTKNEPLVQSKANILGNTIEVSEIAETTSLGAAMLAGIGTGDFKNIGEAVDGMGGTTRQFDPDAVAMKESEERYGVYQQLYPSLRTVHHQLSQFEAT